ncbi:hypothetical protein J2Z19_003630 [Ensifer adhaerens]|uniref:Uncharacterized protein n=1 Tax=Ensifer adhaerens TaxID=106592 RepID=A0ACC5SZ22_ENSAD|nr:hypothetical protein [Ensifer adhaerens]MBP1873911.1 hypothetical protein [Ensifer adhaerens]
MAPINDTLPRPNCNMIEKRVMSPALKRAALSVLLSLVACLRPAAGMQPCPSEKELLARAQIVVEARAKSFSISESGLLVSDGMPTRMTRTVLDIKKVIKGEFSAKEATLYGGVFLPGPVRELAVMAVLYGSGDEDTFEIELSRQEIGDSGIAYLALGDCLYYKFPSFMADLP